MDVKALPTFDCNDTSNLSARWKRWIRAFELYAVGKGITDADQKKALLLHTAGMETQDIYFTLSEVEGEADVYEKAKTALSDHFTPQANIPYERHIFRRMAQVETESIDQFVTKLRAQADLCSFGDQTKVDEQIRDQVIDKCCSHRLRRRFLEKGGELKLKQLLDTARVFEDSEKQAASISQNISHTVAKVTSKPKRIHKKEKSSRQSDTSKLSNSFECFACGNTGHKAKEDTCPAKGKECNKCHLIGHFAKKCRTKANRMKNKNRVRQVAEATNGSFSDSENEYAFSVGQNFDGTKVNMNIGGTDISMLVDTGATCNIIDRSTWELLKVNNIQCQSSKVTKNIFTYGSEEPLKVAGSFCAHVHWKNKKLSNVEFLVFEGKGQSLLSRQTALDLGILSFEPSVNAVRYYSDYEMEFPNLFKGVGKYNNFQLHIPIDKNVSQVAQPLRRVPYNLRDKLDKKLDELESADIIEKCSGPSGWVSPLVCVPKANGEEVRVCVDMRRANEAVVRERHPIPTVEDIMQDLNQSKVFSKLDLKWGYHQIVLDEESREITTFNTHRGLYRYKRLMFGISCAPEMYQKVIQQLLNGCEGVHNIQDDIIIHAENVELHNERLKKVLNILSESGLTLNKEKCQFCVDKLVFMGHLLSNRGVGPSESKVTAVVNAREPENASEVKSFLGLVSYSSRFIPDFATVSAPLRELTKKNCTFIWGDEQKQSFKKLKNLLASADVLGYYETGAETQVIADASPVGLGAVLVQRQKGEFRVICYASRSLSDVERRYSQTEKEALALVWACERFHTYLFGSKFKLLTDHKPLEFIYSPRSKPSARIERWVLRLQPYDYEVSHIPGKQNIADVLSRLLQTSSSCNEKENVADEYIKFVAKEATPIAMTISEIESASENDSNLQAIRSCLLTGAWHGLTCKEYLPVRNELSAIGKLVLRGTRIVVPSSIRERVLELAHEGHPGIVSMKRRLRTKVWWPGIDRQVDSFCKSCHGCQLVSKINNPEPMVRTDLPSGPWQHLAADLLGPLPSGDFILVVVDYYSRFFEIDIVKTTTSEKIISCLMKIFMTHGLPLTLRTDNGPQFVSKEFEQYLIENGIGHRKTTPLWPQANGEVERQNRSIMKRVRIAQSQNKDWKLEIQNFLIMYRSTPHSTTGVSPAELLFKRSIRTKLPQLMDSSVNDFEVRDRDSEKKEKEKIYADKRRGARAHDIQTGDKVLVRQDKVNKFSTVFNPTPLTVLQKYGNSVLVESESGAQYKRNVTSIKPYIQSHGQGITCNQNKNDLINVDEEIVSPNKRVNLGPKVANGSNGTYENSIEKKMQEANQEQQFNRRKSERSRKVPARFEGFEMN